MNFFWNRKAKNININYPEIVSLLEQGKLETIDKILWHPHNKRIEYLPIVYDMMMKFKKPITSNQSLTIHKIFDKEKYQLIVFEIPWLNREIKYSPIIFDKSTSKAVGIMLPFNELLNILSDTDNSEIGKLGIEWTGFILSLQFGI